MKFNFLKIFATTFLYTILILSNLFGLIESKITKILGNIYQANYLTDNSISDNNFAIFKFKKFKDFAFIIEIDKTSYIEELYLYFLNENIPQKIEIELSQNLFYWEKIKDPPYLIDYNPKIKLLFFKTKPTAAKFLQIKFMDDNIDEKNFKISEIIVKNNDSLKVNTAQLLVENISENSVKLKTITDVDTIVNIKYGLSLENLLEGPISIEFKKENIFSIEGLLKGTDYFFLGIVQDCNNNIKYTQPLKIKTKGIPLPLIKEYKVLNTTCSQIETYFKSNIETIFNLYYGYSPDNFKKISSKKFRTEHKFILKNLKPETFVYYKIEIIDRWENTFTSQIYSVKTLPENITYKALISGDFKFIGENLAPQFIEPSSAIKRLYDNDFSYLNGSVMSDNIFAKDQILQFDFKNIISIDRIDFVWWALIYSTKMNLEISSDGNNWLNIAENKNIDQQVKYDFPINIPYVVSRIKINRNLRYIKAIFKKNECFRKFPQYLNLRLLEVIITPDKKYSDEIVPFID